MGESARDDKGSAESAAAARILSEISGEVQASFARDKRILSFEEYLKVFTDSPTTAARDAATYVHDMILSYGKKRVQTAAGDLTRYHLFDQEFGAESLFETRPLVGQEAVQEELVRSLANFRREGHANRVLLLHGPNGSAKSTIAACLMAGLEDYSKKDDGALYRFHWVFPKRSSVRGSIGFSGGKGGAVSAGSSFAHLSDEELEVRIFVEVRDHPLFLLPPEARQRLLKSTLGEGKRLPRWITEGTLCHKNQQIFSALLTSSGGDLEEVLRHVQVERYFLSRRYRVGAVTLGPELSVDATERQVTADRNLGSLPASLQALSLYDVGGELVDASGGVLELSDILKRPIDAFKYLQTTVETGEVSLGAQNLQVNCVFLASGNEVHLAAFREHPEYESFRGRFQPIQVPYLRNHLQEQAIYDSQVAKRAALHVAPHATAVAARFAVLTRLLKPIEEHFDASHRQLVKEMTAWTKLLAYSGELTEVQVDGRRVSLKPLTQGMAEEWQGTATYEGIFGVSPRVMRTVLFDALQHQDFDYLSPFAVLFELDDLCSRVQEYGFLRQESRQGGFHDHVRFRKEVREWLFDTIEDEFRRASGLVDESGYKEMLRRYVAHVSAWVKGEKVKNPLTGAEDPPDEALLGQVEALLAVTDKKAAREALLSRIAAWAIEHPRQKVADSHIMQEMFTVIRKAVFEERRAALGDFCRALLDEGEANEQSRGETAAGLRQLIETFGYTEKSARDTAARLIAERFNG